MFKNKTNSMIIRENRRLSREINKSMVESANIKANSNIESSKIMSQSIDNYTNTVNDVSQTATIKLSEYHKLIDENKKNLDILGELDNLLSNLFVSCVINEDFSSLNYNLLLEADFDVLFELFKRYKTNNIDEVLRYSSIKNAKEIGKIFINSKKQINCE